MFSAAERRALGDFARHPKYKGQKADMDALLSLEKRKLLKRYEMGADKQPIFVLTKKGKALVKRGL